MGPGCRRPPFRPVASNFRILSASSKSMKPGHLSIPDAHGLSKTLEFRWALLATIRKISDGFQRLNHLWIQGGCHPGPEGYGWNVQIGVLPNRSMAPHLSGFCDWRGDSNSNLRGPMMQQLVPEKAAVRRPLDFLYRCLSLGMSFLRWTILKKCRERRDDRAGLKPCEPPGGEENRRRLAHAQVDGCGRIKPGGRHEGGGIGGIGIGARAVPIRFLAPGFD